MISTELANKHCAPCNGLIPLLSVQQIDGYAKQLHADWQLSDNSTSIQRKFVFKGFAKAT